MTVEKQVLSLPLVLLFVLTIGSVFPNFCVYQKSTKRGWCFCSCSLKHNWHQNRLDSVAKGFPLKLVRSSHTPTQKPRQIKYASEESTNNSAISPSATDFTQEMKQDFSINLESHSNAFLFSIFSHTYQHYHSKPSDHGFIGENQLKLCMLTGSRLLVVCVWVGEYSQLNCTLKPATC